MNHQIPPYNQNVPILSHTDWASMAKQWATLRANVNIPPTVNKIDNYNYHNIPPPPPPPPCLSMPKSNVLSYDNDYQTIVDHDQMISFNRNISNAHNSNNNIYEPSVHSFYEEMLPANPNSTQCETFDYNHRDRAFVNFNNINPYRPPPSPVAFTQNIFNMPPPTHQDYIDTQQQQQLKSTSFMQDPPPAKLFPIINTDEYNLVTNQSIMPNHIIAPLVKQSLPFLNKYDNPAEFATTRSNKGLPAWIIDDMKKIKEKERKQPYTTSMDDFRDHPVNSKRDEEGDIVMEDVIKESEIESILSGKSVITTNRIDASATEIDIDDVNLNDEDDGFDKIDYSSKSLIDLIEMLEENELDNLKIVIIRDSLTGIMKQVTDDMISEVVNSTFSKELSKINVKPKVKAVPRDSKTVHCISDATVKPLDGPAIVDMQPDSTCHLLGLDVYESDEEVVDNIETEKDTTERSSTTSDSKWMIWRICRFYSDLGRKRWSSHKKSSESKVDTKKSSSHSKDSQKLEAKEKKKTSTDTSNTISRNLSPKRRNRSKSRDHSRKRSKSRDRRRSRSKDRNGGGGGNGPSSSHKKSKKHHNHSPDSRDYKWKNDKCDNRSSSGKKQSKRDRSRS